MTSVRFIALAETKRLLPWVLPVALAGVWYMACETGVVSGYLLPHPMKILKAAHTYIFAAAGSAPYAGRFWDDAYASLVRVFSGFGLAVSMGLPLGLLSGRLPPVHSLLSTILNAIRAVPGICWLPLALVWFGIGLRTTLFLVALASFFPIYLNTAEGARRIDPVLCQSGAMMGVGRIRGIFTILLPAAMPHIVTGLRLGLGLAWAYLVLGELTGVPDGIGAVIMDARMLGRIDIIMVGIIIISAMGRFSDIVLQTGLKACLKSARLMP
jgi:NitT/TauT family transport system permease protein